MRRRRSGAPRAQRCALKRACACARSRTHTARKRNRRARQRSGVAQQCKRRSRSRATRPGAAAGRGKGRGKGRGSSSTICHPCGNPWARRAATARGEATSCRRCAAALLSGGAERGADAACASRAACSRCAGRTRGAWGRRRWGAAAAAATARGAAWDDAGASNKLITHGTLNNARKARHDARPQHRTSWPVRRLLPTCRPALDTRARADGAPQGSRRKSETQAVRRVRPFLLLQPRGVPAARQSATRRRVYSGSCLGKKRGLRGAQRERRPRSGGTGLRSSP